MEREEFTNSVKEVIQNYIDDFFEYDKNPMLRINPELKLVEVENGYAFQEDIGYNDEAIEEAAAAEGDADESSTDYQAKQNFDFYPVGNFLKHNEDGTTVVDDYAVEQLADKYFN